jgi:LysM repeat protein
MAPGRLSVLSLILLFTLAGCFRQASEPIAPVNGSASDQLEPLPTRQQPAVVTSVTTPETTANADTTSGPGIAVTASTSVPLATSTATAVASFTPIATDDQSGSVTGPVQMASPSATFVTPVSPNQGAVSTATRSSSLTIEPTPTDLVQSSTDSEDLCVHEVQRGDTLFRIAQAYDTTVDDIVAANPDLNPTLILVGEEIIIPDCNPDGSDVAEATEDVTTIGALGDLIHTVSAGETLGQIANRYGVTIDSIVEANDLADANRLSIGQELLIPPSTAP